MRANDNKLGSTKDTATKALEFVPAVAVAKPAAPPETRALELIPAVPVAAASGATSTTANPATPPVGTEAVAVKPSE